MTLNSTSRLAIAELVIYAILFPVVVYILIRHGKHGLMGWFFLTSFCILRMVADGLQISDGIKQSKGESFSIVGPIINSVGVSPLMLSVAGVLLEAAYYAIPDTPRLLRIVLHVFFHFAVATGIALAAVGASKLASPQTSSNSYSSDQGLLEAGYLILLVVVIILVIYTVYVRMNIGHSSRRVVDAEHQRHVDNPLFIKPLSLVHCSMLALVLILARVIYGIVYAFSNNKVALSPVTGSFAIKFMLVFGVQLLAALCLIVGGLSSLGK